MNSSKPFQPVSQNVISTLKRMKQCWSTKYKILSKNRCASHACEWCTGL